MAGLEARAYPRSKSNGKDDVVELPALQEAMAGGRSG
jgi:hypothetical protein